MHSSHWTSSPHNPLVLPNPPAPSTPPTTNSPLLVPSLSLSRITNAPVSPPTPAPSPTLSQQWDRMHIGRDEVPERQRTLLATGKGKGREVEVEVDGNGEGTLDPTAMLECFQQYTTSERFAFVNSLVPELRLDEALLVSRKIEPRLRRDFLKELPVELALHCLSFVDDACTLARAARVSRFWNQLFSDDSTWREICQRQRFTQLTSPFLSHSTQSRQSRRTNPQAGSVILNPHAMLEERESQRRRRLAAEAASRGIGLSGWGGLSGKEIYIAQSEDEKARHLSPGGSFKQQFKDAYLTENNWLHGGRLIASCISPDDGAVTTVAMNEKYLIIGLANAKISIFDATTGAIKRHLIGHSLGVWTLTLISPNPIPRTTPGATGSPSKRSTRSTNRDADNTGSSPRGISHSHRASFDLLSPDAISRYGNLSPPPSEAPHVLPGNDNTTSPGSLPNTSSLFGTHFPVSHPPSRPNTAPIPQSSRWRRGQPRFEAKKMRQSDLNGNAKGWLGLKRSLVVSAGCDRVVKVWDVHTGRCVHTLQGHESTIRCLKVLDGLPIAVTGSRDFTVRVWNIELGEELHCLRGHGNSVRCLEVAGHVAVSGSYDYTARMWDIERGECLQTFTGHYGEIYAVAFDGEKVVTGSLDSTVRVWSAATGECLALLQGHTSLVGQLQLTNDRLVTGGSDGRVIVFNLASIECIHRLCAHDNSVTCLQFNDRFIVSGGNDGRVKLWDLASGRYLRELTTPCDAVWRITFRDDRVAILCQRMGHTVLELVSFRPEDDRR